MPEQHDVMDGERVIGTVRKEPYALFAERYHWVGRDAEGRVVTKFDHTAEDCERGVREAAARA